MFKIILASVHMVMVHVCTLFILSAVRWWWRKQLLLRLLGRFQRLQLRCSLVLEGCRLGVAILGSGASVLAGNQTNFRQPP